MPVLHLPASSTVSTHEFHAIAGLDISGGYGGVSELLPTVSGAIVSEPALTVSALVC